MPTKTFFHKSSNLLKVFHNASISTLTHALQLHYVMSNIIQTCVVCVGERRFLSSYAKHNKTKDTLLLFTNKCFQPIQYNMVFLQLKTLFFLLLAIATFGHPFQGATYHPHPCHSLQTDKAALVQFKKTIISDPHSSLANWDEAVHVCNFTGVECDESQQRITRLILHDNGLVGLLSPVLSNLTRLHVLEIVHNRLYGIIPPEYSSLVRLHRIILEGNDLHGSIPESFSKLSKLNILVIKENNITGSLPPSLFSNCTLLDIVDFSGNSLSGEIPQEIEIAKAYGVLVYTIINSQESFLPL